MLMPLRYDHKWGYSQALNTVLVTLSLGLGIPLILCIGACTLLALWLTEKYKLAKFCKRPPRLSQQLVHISIGFLSLGLLLHLFFSISMLGSTYIFLQPLKEKYDQDFSSIRDILGPNSKITDDDFQDLSQMSFDGRFVKFARCLPLSILLLISLLVLVAVPLALCLASQRLEKNREKHGFLLEGDVLKQTEKNDWSDYDFRFKKENIVIVYGWDKFCFKQAPAAK